MRFFLLQLIIPITMSVGYGQTLSKADSLQLLAREISVHDTVLEYKILFFETFPNSFTELKEFYDNKGKLSKYAYEHQQIFLEVIKDTNIVSICDGIKKISLIITGFEPSVDNLGQFYQVVGSYCSGTMTISDLLICTSKIERDSLISFLGQSQYPPGVKLLEDFLADSRLKEHHSLIKSCLKKLENQRNPSNN